MFRRSRDTRSILCIFALLGSASVQAETPGGWIDPPSDRELLQMVAAVPPPGDPVAPASHVAEGLLDPAVVGIDHSAPPDRMEEGAAATEDAKLSEDQDGTTGLVKVRKNPKPSRAAVRNRIRKSGAGVPQGDPFARIFGPPRRDSHIITTTHNR